MGNSGKAGKRFAGSVGIETNRNILSRIENAVITVFFIKYYRNEVAYMNSTNTNVFDNLPDVLSIMDVAKALRVGRSKATNIVRFSDLPYVKLGNSYRVTKKSFLDWVERSEKREYAFEQ